jgi:hypothetical protein
LDRAGFSGCSAGGKSTTFRGNASSGSGTISSSSTSRFSGETLFLSENGGGNSDFREKAAKRAEEVLKANKAVLDKLAEELLAHETLEEAELEPILKDAKIPEIVKLHK